jgi:hypothetical protein
MSGMRGASSGDSAGWASLDLNINLTVDGVPWEPSAASGLGVALVAAAYVGPLGGVATPPQFATSGLTVSHPGTGIYRLAFPGYAPDRRYVVTATAHGDSDSLPRIVERLINADLDDSLGLYLSIRTTSGTSVDNSFGVQVHEYTG